MRSFSGHSISFARLMVLLFVLANSGFTMVMYTCSMGCCGDGRICAPAGSGGRSSVPHSPIAIAGARLSCMSMTIAGGFHTDPTVVEKKFSARPLHGGVVLAALSDQQPVIHSLPSSTLKAFAGRWVVPSSVEKCALNSTFLI